MRKSNLNNELDYLKHNSKSYKEHLALAREQLDADCLYGAYCEYKSSLELHPDPSVNEEFKNLLDRAVTSRDDDSNGAIFVKLAEHLDLERDGESDRIVFQQAFCISRRETSQHHQTRLSQL